MLCGAAVAQSQAAGAYKYVLNQYKAVKAQIAPWVEQFQAQHGRSPCSTDAEASGKPAMHSHFLATACGDGATRHPSQLAVLHCLRLVLLLQQQTDLKVPMWADQGCVSRH